MTPIYADLFSFAFVPNWYLQLDELAELALPEPWCFRHPVFESKNPYTPILERYIQAIFRKQIIDYNTAEQAKKDEMFLMRNEFSCFHTGLYTKHYKPIYGFVDEISPMLRYVTPLP